MFYVTINLNNTTTQYATLNALADTSLFNYLCDTTATVQPSVQQMIVVKSPLQTSITYNISEDALLTIGMSLNNDNDWIIVPTVQGSTEYAVTGYSSPSSGPTVENKDYYTAFILTVSQS